jgi:hypothetical protein
MIYSGIATITHYTSESSLFFYLFSIPGKGCNTRNVAVLRVRTYEFYFIELGIDLWSLDVPVSIRTHEY